MSIKFLILAVTINAVAGQLLLKRALNSIGGRVDFSNLPQFALAAAKSPWIYASLAVQAFGYFMWMILISRVKIGIATASVAAGFYILMALSAWALYGESLSYWQWIGIVLITAGVTCIGLKPA